MLAGNTHPQANSANDRGRVADDFQIEHMWLQLKRSPEQQAALDRYTEELSDPNSPNYHKWLTARELGEQFGASEQDIETISNWLRSHGLVVNGVQTNRILVDVSGTAKQVSEAFHTEIHHLSVNGEAHFANMGDPQIPAALEPALAGVVKMNDFMPHALHTGAQVHAPNDRGISPNYTFNGGQFYFVAPQDLETIYNLTPLYTAGYSGKGQTIVVFEDSDVYTSADWTQFRKMFGLAKPYVYGTFTQEHPMSTTTPCVDPGFTGDDIEAIIDAQWASAAAPNANIILAACANTTNFGGFIAMENMLNASATPPAIMSISYGGAEAEQGTAENAFINALYEQAVAEGVSVFVSSGDSGADANVVDRQNNIATTGISANGLGSTPYNVAVGGTDYEDTFLGENSTYWNSTNTNVFGSAKSYIPEIPWNQSCGSVLIAEAVGFSTTYGPNGFCASSFAKNNGFLNVVAASGAPSAIYSKPVWQSILGNPSDGARDLPDVSLFAAAAPWSHALVLCYSQPIGSPPASYPCAQGYFFDDGGTSFAAPTMAGIQSLVNQKTGTRWGNPNPIYYSLGSAEYGASGSSSCNSLRGNAVASTCIFYDVTQGDMDVYCKGGTPNCFTGGATNGVLSVSTTSYEPAYPATTGWDFATGIGTVNAFNLVMNWPTMVSPSISAKVSPGTAGQ